MFKEHSEPPAILELCPADTRVLQGNDGGVESLGLGRIAGGLVIGTWLAVLIAVLVLARTVYKDSDNPLSWFEVFYRIGSIIYGGGQVVLPMLQGDLVQKGPNGKDAIDTWVTTEQFFAGEQVWGQPLKLSRNVCGYRLQEIHMLPVNNHMGSQHASAVVMQVCQLASTHILFVQEHAHAVLHAAGLGVVQAMPGPLFNFSTYLGCIIAIRNGYTFILGAVLAWFGLFSPGVMLMFGTLPFWKKFRTWQLYRRGLPGMNAVGVGLILASVFNMTISVYNISPFKTSSLCIALFAFCAVDELNLFEPFVVLGGGVLGILAWGAKMR